ncbi:hypothetical protein ACFX13_007254 [Malus domestica]
MPLLLKSPKLCLSLTLLCCLIRPPLQAHEGHFRRMRQYLYPSFGIISYIEDHTPTNKKWVQDNSDDSVHNSAEVKQLSEYLMGFLDDLDTDPMTQDLDLIMKNFEKEIAAATTSCHSSPPLGKKGRSLRGMISRAVVSNARGAGTHNVFPSFLPNEVDKIKYPYARTLARRMERLHVPAAPHPLP